MRRLLAFLPLVSLIAWVGCSSSSDGVDVDTSGNQPDNPGEDLLVGDGVPGAGASGEERTCLGETHQAEARGLDIFVMLDISGSMSEALPRVALLAPSQTKWDAVKQSLEAFVQSPESADIGVGLQYFPQQKPDVPLTCNSNAECGAGAPCTTSICVRPVDAAQLGTFLTSAQPGCAGPTCYCSSNADCGAGETCREMNGQCVLPGEGFLPLAPPLLALCNADADCAGINIDGIACEQQGVCQNLINGQLGGCSPTIPCLPGGGACGPLPQFCVNETSCEAPVYAAPAVTISTGATHTNAIIQSLEAVELNGLTPTGPALRGALEHARAWALEHPDRQVVTVFATDGLPTECTPQDGPAIAQLAADANTGADPVRTFVIGVFGAADLGQGRALLDSLASAGGSERAFVINTGGDVGSEFLEALNQIRDTAVSCEFQLDGDAALDFDRVNLRISDPAGAVEALANVGDVSACGSEQGWYYTRNAEGTPTQIQVCPSTCTRLTTTSGISAELEVGCATRIR